MTMRTPYSWGIAVLAGVVAEIGVFAVMPIALRFGPAGPLYAIPPAAFFMTCVAAIAAGSVASSHPVAHGAVVGLVAAVIYIGITLGQRLPAAYVAAHFLKVLGGMAGGFLVLVWRRRRPFESAK